jgi:hypothetical protein
MQSIWLIWRTPNEMGTWTTTKFVEPLFFPRSDFWKIQVWCEEPIICGSFSEGKLFHIKG